MEPESFSQPPPSTSSFPFIQGFFLGQLSIVIIFGVFIRFFIFGDVTSIDASTSSRQHRLKPNNSQHASKKQSNVLRQRSSLTTTTILEKTYYNVKSHLPESVDWFNVLFAQTIAQFRNDAQHDNAILISLNSAFNGAQKPNFLDEIKITELSLGEDFPIFSNCRVIPVEEDAGSSQEKAGDRLQARMDVDLTDSITLGVETKMVLNYPRPFVAVLPVALTVSVVRFTGTLSVSFVPSSPPTPSPTTLAFSFSDDYRLELVTHSLVGSRSRLQDVPKIAQIIEARLHAWFDERCVEPRFQQITLPSLWPKKQNTGGGERHDDNSDGGIEAVQEGINTTVKVPVEREANLGTIDESLRRRIRRPGVAVAL